MKILRLKNDGNMISAQTKGMEEVTAAKTMYDIIFPKLHDHQVICTKNDDEFCTKKDEVCTKREEFCI